MSKQTKYIGFFVTALLLTYVGSYIVLRCSAMRFAANRRVVHGEAVIKTWVYFGDGDNTATRAATATYVPLIRIEYAWKLHVLHFVIYG